MAKEERLPFIIVIISLLLKVLEEVLINIVANIITDKITKAIPEIIDRYSTLVLIMSVSIVLVMKLVKLKEISIFTDTSFLIRFIVYFSIIIALFILSICTYVTFSRSSTDVFYKLSSYFALFIGCLIAIIGAINLILNRDMSYVAISALFLALLTIPILFWGTATQGTNPKLEYLPARDMGLSMSPGEYVDEIKDLIVLTGSGGGGSGGGEPPSLIDIINKLMKKGKDNL